MVCPIVEVRRPEERRRHRRRAFRLRREHSEPPPGVDVPPRRGRLRTWVGVRRRPALVVVGVRERPRLTGSGDTDFDSGDGAGENVRSVGRLRRRSGRTLLQVGHALRDRRVVG